MTTVAQQTNVVPFPAPEPDESWLTQERIEAYYVALSFMPAIVDASPVARDAVIDKMIAGLRAARKLDDELDAKGRAQCIALMRYDAEQRAERLKRGGW